ncbi:MAG: glycosyltransferase family 4 protein [Ignavibacteriae bacterium]|nr:glycosyltransferase family 4 protein [Ignavibacteriota bacterium]
MFTVIAVAPFDEWSHQFEQKGIQYIPLSLNRRSLNPLTDAILFWRLFKIYKKEQPDFIFHNTIKPVIYGTQAARFAGTARILNMIPGLGYVFIGKRMIHRWLRPFVEAMYRMTLRYSYMVFFQNQDDRDYFIKRKLIDAHKILVVPGSGVDPEYFYFVEPIEKKDETIFLFIGRILLDKGVKEFVEAAEVVKKNFPCARFQLLGKIDEGNPSYVSKNTIKTWSHHYGIEYLGELTDVRNIIKDADVVVLPSYREGIPRSILEAMAMGKAIITTDVPGCRETVLHNTNGLLIPPRDLQALVDAMITMLKHQERRIQMGIESRKLVLEHFTVQKVNSLIINTLKK